MSNPTPATLDQLRRARRWFWIEIAAASAVMVAGIALMIIYNLELLAAVGAAVGGSILRFAFALWQRHTARLGYTAHTAKDALDADRDRRTGVDQLTVAQQAARVRTRATITMALGLLSGVLLVAAAVIFSQRAGRTAEEGAPLDVWIPVSLGTGIVTLIATPVLLLRAKMDRAKAAAMLTRRRRR